jgi:hypothetical protein
MQTGRSGIPHLWFIITEPDPESNQCVMVSLTTLRYGKDQTVILRAGDHSFITKDSIILFSDAMLVDANSITAQINAGTIRQHDDCSPEALRLIQDGLLSSPQTPNKFLALCRRAWGQATRHA